MSGGLSVISDLSKTLVYSLIEYINKDKIIVPKNILTKKPSAELNKNQFDQNFLPNYDLLDKILYYYIEEGKSLDELLSMGIKKTEST